MHQVVDTCAHHVLHAVRGSVHLLQAQRAHGGGRRPDAADPHDGALDHRRGAARGGGAREADVLAKNGERRKQADDAVAEGGATQLDHPEAVLLERRRHQPRQRAHAQLQAAVPGAQVPGCGRVALALQGGQLGVEGARVPLCVGASTVLAGLGSLGGGLIAPLGLLERAGQHGDELVHLGDAGLGHRRPGGALLVAKDRLAQPAGGAAPLGVDAEVMQGVLLDERVVGGLQGGEEAVEWVAASLPLEVHPLGEDHLHQHDETLPGKREEQRADEEDQQRAVPRDGREAGRQRLLQRGDHEDGGHAGARGGGGGGRHALLHAEDAPALDEGEGQHVAAPDDKRQAVHQAQSRAGGRVVPESLTVGASLDEGKQPHE
mmetsp:Transcript_12951/g.33407  ORF Transcript_12951/g.33407 Transcript_12951/m.33407 type:complete len:376 (-) Transcript_12951:538-1665(-)